MSEPGEGEFYRLCDEAYEGKTAEVLAAGETQRPTVVAVHGAGGGAWEWQLWQHSPLNSQVDFEAVQLEPRGSLECTTLNDYVQQVVEFCNRLKRSGPLYLVGASMGGMVVARSAAILKAVAGVVFVCSMLPSPWGPPKKTEYPAVVFWAGGDVQETIEAIPDASLETCRFAAERWRNESGAVLNAISSGIEWKSSMNTRYCSIVPLADDTINPNDQLAFGAHLSAHTLTYEGMSHCGPLLGRRAEEVAAAVADWIFQKRLS